MRHRTALVTAGAIVGVLAAGATAVGASLGILDATGDSPVGQLDLSTAQAPETVEVVIDRPVPLDSAGASLGQQVFAIDSAGTVTLAVAEGQLLLDSVDPASGWSTSQLQLGDTELVIELTDGVRVLVFNARVTDGAIEGVVEEIQLAPAPASDDDYEDDDHHEYEDDDHHEYEGGDRDD